MSIIMGRIAGALVKGLAGATVARGVEAGLNTVITSTGLLETATQATKTVVRVGTTAAGLATGTVVVNALVDTANKNGTPITGRKVIFAETVPMYTENGVLIGTPTHKKSDKIVVEVVGEGPD